MNLSHPLRISFCKVIIDGYDADTFAFQCIQVCRQCRNKCLTFTGLHLCNTSLVKNDTTDKLYTVMLHSKDTFAGLTYNGKCLRKQVIQCLSLFETFLELSRFSFQFLVA